jgi:uncharacterized protein YyaL (SSP411 family)
MEGGGAMHTNALIGEKSPYLLQHAHNPVNWAPWGEEAFRAARERDAPVFLSIGYSTCHWCHVMERESFENEAIAELLNRYFIPIKVDREERPDVDRIYMTFVQATTGSGGWPMSVFLTPERQPFFGGTYFPPEPWYGRPGFREALEKVAEAWRLDRASIVESGGKTMAELARIAKSAPGYAAPDAATLDSGFYAFRRDFDTRHGGFGGAPKFPRPAVLSFLFRYWERTGSAEALEMSLATLNAMARGGIRDHLGGGFHRYAVDERWFVPHFEKMLYDQAQLATAYLEGYQISGDQTYAQAARETLDYLLRDLRDAGGAFHSAEDADSEGREGQFYIWSAAEIEEALGRPAAEWFLFHYGCEERGNAPGEFAGRNILVQAHTVEETARRFGKTEGEVSVSLDASRRRLLERRAGRPRPGLDDKILTAWNGLAISALAKAAQALGEARYGDAAREAAEFILGRLYDAERSTLLRRYRDGDARIAGFLDDYAFFVQGLLDLYETVFEARYLNLAEELTGRQRALFEDAEGGGFYSTAEGGDGLGLRLKDEYDGAEPSGNSVAALNLLRLAEMTGREDFRESAERTLRWAAGRLHASPSASPQMLCAAAWALGPRREIVIAGKRGAPDTEALLHVVHQRFAPGGVTLLVDGEETRRRLSGRLPAVAAMNPVNGAAAAYVCENFACQAPATNPADLERRWRDGAARWQNQRAAGPTTFTEG